MNRFPWSQAPAWAALASLVLVVFPATASAQESAEALRSDRPGLGDGSWVLAPGVWQAELGATLRDSGPDGYVSGEGLLRVGLTGVELRVFLPSLAVGREGDDVALDDVGVGAKLFLAENRGWSWALTGAVTLPTSTVDEAPDESTGAAGVVAETALSETVGFAVNAGYGFPFNAVGEGTFSLLLTPGVSLGDGMGAYAGYAGYFGDGTDAHFLEAGLTKVTDTDTQWDVNAGYDVENDAWFLGVGLARRWR